MKRCFLLALLLALAASTLDAADNRSATGEQATRPNVLVIMVDDMGYSDVGCYGGEIRTPNIDRLADGGVRFSQFYNCARCCPTRASLLTGAYPHRVGLANNGRTMSLEAPTLADRLKAAGYETAMAGKWHLSELAATDDERQRIRWMNHQVDLGIPFADPGSYPIRRGFDRYYGVIWGVVNHFDPFSLVEGDRPVKAPPDDDFYLADAITDYSIRTIHDFAPTDEPFFLYVAHTAPHWPIHAPPEDIDRYKGRYDAGWDVLRKERFQRQVKLGLFDADMPLGDVITRGPTWDELSRDEQAYQSAKLEVHAAMVDRVDQGIGRIVAALEETGQLDNTVIFFLSDNGASPEIPGPPGYDRYAETRDGRPALREAQLQQGNDRAKLGSQQSYTGIGPAWANAVNTPLRYWKKESYEGGCRTPLIVHWPAGLKAEAGSICRRVGHVMDIAPTCLDLAGASDVQPPGKPPFRMDGLSLAPIFRGRQRDGHEMLFFEHAGGKGARRGDWKISALGRGEWELFNLAGDPGETMNLAEARPDMLASLIDAWRAWYQRVQPEADTSSAANDAPPIARRPLEISCRVETDARNGVILAQGGNQHGVSLHLDDGQLIFTVRVAGRAAATTPAPVEKRNFKIDARLLADGTMELAVDGRPVATGRAAGLLPRQPLDGLSVGRDDRSAVGEYQPPNPLSGKVTEVVVAELKADDAGNDKNAKEANTAKSAKKGASAGRRPPNIVLVFIDDMGWGDFSCFGNQVVETQNIDRLAREGLRFEQFYVNSPICSPSRTAISTGQYPQRWRISSYLARRQLNKDRGMAQWLDPRAPMLARSLHRAGYATGHFGKWHMGGQRDVGEAPLITEYGFDKSLTNFEGLGPRVLPLCDAYDGKPPRKHALGSDKLGHGPIMWEDRSKVTASFTSAALEFIKQAEAQDETFYVNVWPDDVHSPFFPPEARRGDGAKRTLYHGVLDTMDEQLGELFDYLRGSDKLRDNTLLLICSDNGPEFGAGSAADLRGHKTMLYEGGVRSPLIAWGPGLLDAEKAGTVNRESFFAAIDLVPTLLDIAGVEPPRGVTYDGESLPQVVLGKSKASRRAPLFFRRPPDRDAFYGDDDLPDLAVRDGRWKLLCEYDGDDVELYDLATDRGETTNVAEKHPEIVARLREALLAWHKAMPPDNGASFKN